jgi:lipopolysaccharide biosynthesis glycosyltransferase
MKNYPIVTVSDSKFLEPTEYLLTSIVDNYNGNEKLKFYILHVDTEITEKEKQNFKNKFKYENVDITFVTSSKLNNLVKSGEFEKYSEKRKEYLRSINMAEHSLPHAKSMYRLWMGDAVPEDHVIYLDSDTFFYCSIEHFFQIKEPKTKMAAVLDPWPWSWTMHKVPFDDSTPPEVKLFHRKYIPKLAQETYTATFNGGVFITSLDYWREIKIDDMSREFMNEYIMLYNDQDILNYIFGEDFVSLPLAFNCHFKFILDASHRINYNSACPNLPVVVHFCGDFKPLFKNTKKYILHNGEVTGNIPHEYLINPVLKRYLQIRKREEIKKLYKEILNREEHLIDGEGLKRYTYSEITLEEIKNLFYASDEYKKLKNE